MRKSKIKIVEKNPCETCGVEIIGDPPFSIIEYPMPYFCSMECLEKKRGKK